MLHAELRSALASSTMICMFIFEIIVQITIVRINCIFWSPWNHQNPWLLDLWIHRYTCCCTFLGAMAQLDLYATCRIKKYTTKQYNHLQVYIWDNLTNNHCPYKLYLLVTLKTSNPWERPSVRHICKDEHWKRLKIYLIFLLTEYSCLPEVIGRRRAKRAITSDQVQHPLCITDFS
jgi:hypothetical protein